MTPANVLLKYARTRAGLLVTGLSTKYTKQQKSHFRMISVPTGGDHCLRGITQLRRMQRGGEGRISLDGQTPPPGAWRLRITGSQEVPLDNRTKSILKN
jgi:hypothetical protein